MDASMIEALSSALQDIFSRLGVNLGDVNPQTVGEALGSYARLRIIDSSVKVAVSLVAILVGVSLVARARRVFLTGDEDRAPGLADVLGTAELMLGAIAFAAGLGVLASGLQDLLGWAFAPEGQLLAMAYKLLEAR